MKGMIKRVVLIAGVVVSAAALMARADFHGKISGMKLPAKTQEPCTGYVVIEAGKGIDCKGDTIRLRKQAGYYEVIRAR